MLERDVVKNNNKHHRRGDGVDNTHPEITTSSTTTDLVLQWGSRKRLRCMKIQVKDDSTDPNLHKTTVRVNRRVVRTDKDCSGHSKDNGDNDHHRLLRNSETWRAMKGQNNGFRSSFSPERRWENRKGNNDQNKVAGTSGSSETAQDIKKGGSSSGSEEVPVWPPNFVIALSSKEKEEDFMAIKGCKLPQRPKKRAKFMQRTINLVSPGGWLCDLTLERYEVREKKISKKRPRGLKAMGNADSDSE